MSNTFIISDTHFGHDNIYNFKDVHGNPARYPFKSAAECDDCMVTAWNYVVKPTDKVYHLGDVAIKRKSLEILKKLNGRKVLIRGNHDIYDLSDYTPYFYDIRGSHKLENLILSHYPLHESGLRFNGWCKGNVHGHVHLNSLPDRRYFNACVEMTNYAPVPIEFIFKYYENLNHS